MNIKKILFVGCVANILEWYDYSLFIHLVILLGVKFFPTQDPHVAVLHGFLVFAIGYVARPLGGIFWGIIGDKFGRKTSLSFSIMCMSIPTIIIGLTPTYETIGIFATIIMIIARMLQGLSMGGALTSSISFLIEHSKPKHRGFIGSIPMFSICIGILLSSLVLYGTRYVLTESQFNNFGWRVPFLLGILIIFAGIYIKKYTDETPIFHELKIKNKVVSSPLRFTLQHYKKDILIAICVNATGSVIFYLQAAYLPSYLRLYKNLSEHFISATINYSYAFMAVVTLIAGHLSTIIGRKRFYLILLTLIIAITPYSFYVIETTNEISKIVICIFVLATLAGAYIAAEPVFMVELYNANVRNTAMAISYSIGTSIFGGATPYILGFLLTEYGTIQSFSYYVAGIAVLGVIAMLNYKPVSCSYDVP